MDKSTPTMLRTANGDWLGEARKFYGAFEDIPKDGEFGLNTRHTMVGRIEILANGEQQASFVPCLINADNEPVPVSPLSPEGREITAFVASITEEAGMVATFRPTEDAVLVL
jgi:hypothetical protein